MSVYEKENPIYFNECIYSVLSQTVLPDELIIVKDGPLTDDLEQIIQGVVFPNSFHVISLPANVTQGPARAEGIKLAKHDWIAIMDSDDICAPDRFEKQLRMIESDERLSLIGGQISEFRDDPKNASASRSVPCDHASIVNFVKYRNPFNCMTVMMKRELVLRAGNFQYFPFFEDYDLWVRMIKAGAVCANHPDVLVKVRVGAGMYARRRGMSYIRFELRLQRTLKELGIINAAEYIRNIAARIPMRLLPEKALVYFYNKFLRKIKKNRGE